MPSQCCAWPDFTKVAQAASGHCQQLQPSWECKHLLNLQRGMLALLVDPITDIAHHAGRQNTVCISQSTHWGW